MDNPRDEDRHEFRSFHEFHELEKPCSHHFQVSDPRDGCRGPGEVMSKCHQNVKNILIPSRVERKDVCLDILCVPEVPVVRTSRNRSPRKRSRRNKLFSQIIQNKFPIGFLIFSTFAPLLAPDRLARCNAFLRRPPLETSQKHESRDAATNFRMTKEIRSLKFISTPKIIRHVAVPLPHPTLPGRERRQSSWNGRGDGPTDSLGHSHDTVSITEKLVKR